MWCDWKVQRCVNCLSVRHTLSTWKSNSLCKYCYKAHHSLLCRIAIDHPNASRQDDSDLRDYGHSYNTNTGQFRPPAPLPLNQPASSPPTANTAPPARPQPVASASSVHHISDNKVGFSGTATNNRKWFKTVLLGTAIVQVLDACGNRRDLRILIDLSSQNHFVTSHCLCTLCRYKV